MYLVQKSDTSHSIYPRIVFMTVFALHPEAIIQGWLLYKPWLLTGKLRYILATFIIMVMNTLVGCIMYMFTTNENSALTMILNEAFFS